MSDPLTEEDLNPSKRACEHIRREFKECILNSDCVNKHNYHPNECLKKHKDLLPEECVRLNTALYECKRSMYDTRRRFRGRRE
ncbi:cytochrome c oxidase assembly factor 5 [Brevipalpus obovatus]|uniref:cytochrome c oxidase assembly factor 5 n=1 Tax=Brevipalpus obovatus TaxID=246614 RepID=UPI003D9EAA62